MPLTYIRIINSNRNLKQQFFFFYIIVFEKKGEDPINFKNKDINVKFQNKLLSKKLESQSNTLNIKFII